MNRITAFKSFIAGLGLLFASDLMASAETDFELGVEAFKSGKNEAAAGYFESALRQGMDSVALRYNLASSYYKLGRYDEAKKYFQSLLDTDAMRDLAEYNLGLVAIKQKEWGSAREHFNSVIKSGRDEKLTGLSKKQIAKLTKEEKPLQGTVLGNIGYDNNIVSVSDGSALNQADSFYDLYASANYLLSGKRKDGWIVDASLYRLDYTHDDDYNIGLFWVGVKKTMVLNGWETGAHLKLYKSTYGDEAYLSSGMIDLTGNRKLSSNDGLYLRYRYEDIRSDDPVYDYLAGWRQRANVEYRHATSNSLAQLTYELEVNNRGELVTPTYSYEYSPTRNSLNAKYTYIFKNKWRIGGDAAYRYSVFPPSDTIDRKDRQWILSLSADYQFDKTFKFTSKVQYIDNQSTEPQYTYDKSIVKIGLSKSF